MIFQLVIKGIKNHVNDYKYVGLDDIKMKDCQAPQQLGNLKLGFKKSVEIKTPKFKVEVLIDFCLLSRCILHNDYQYL